MTSLSFSRRRFLSALGAGGAAALPSLALPRFARQAGAAPKAGHMLLLIELAGGNDGLNTVIPITDARYRALRPTIGAPRRRVLGLDADTALHPAMGGLAALWEAGDLRIVEGVGYPEPDRSHFRSIEIWNSGGGPETKTTTGWVSAAFAEGAPRAGADADGLALGGDLGPLAGPGRFSALRDLDDFLDRAEAAPSAPHAVRPGGARSPLEHVLGVYESARVTSEALRAKLERSRDRDWAFPESQIGAQLHTAARLLDAGVETPVMKVVQDGYDTHERQPDRHAELLHDLSAAIAAFAAHAKIMGLWDRVTLATYSEFGRRAQENASAGTDHGAAAPVLAMGGAVAGGLAGARPSLERLVDGDLAYTTDYRALYAAILSDLWGQPDNAYARAGFGGLRLHG